MGAVAALMALAAPASAQPARSTLHVDARDAARRLVRVRQDIPVEPGPVELNYILWTPGNHNPSGPIQNVVDLTITDDRGRRLDWRRDRELMTRLHVVAPAGASVLTVSFAYITNQPSVISRSTDSYGFREFGGLNWNTALFYPTGADKDEWVIEPDLRLPIGWRAATPLVVARAGSGRVQFAPVTLAELVDSPAIFGSGLRTYELETGSAAPHFIHAVAQDPADTVLGAERLDKFGVMVDQAEAVFGPFPREEYHFLVMLSDDLPSLGVEHNECTLISLSSDRFRTAERDADPIGVIPHEYIHAWCGKLRAPEGLLARDYHTTADTRLLWVYEGLTSYYDDVLAARSGLLTEDEYVATITRRLADSTLREGRLWQSVEDTAVMLRHLRARSPAWGDKRRGTAYYGEGALFWLEADAIIRRGTDGARSLDDFCRAFFGVSPQAPGSPVTYTRADIVHSLNAVYDGEDWDALIGARIERPAATLDQSALAALLGRRLEFTPEPPPGEAPPGRTADARFSLGLVADASGEIVRVVPGSIADSARLGPGMRILAV
ncbi:MAG: hypothetical protein D6693_09640, partial [Planctomycetota bacterium]